MKTRQAVHGLVHVIIWTCWLTEIKGSIDFEDIYLECEAQSVEEINADLVQTIQNPSNSMTNITLYKASELMNWCQSYRKCQSMNPNMAKLLAIPNIKTQDAIKTLAKVSAPAWVAGTRKRHSYTDGSYWTWVNEALTDCTESKVNTNHNFSCLLDKLSTTDAKEYGVFQVAHDSFLYVEQLDPESRIPICNDGYKNASTNSNWYRLQNVCFFREPASRLATFEEAKKMSLGTGTYSIGLQYRPWIWIREKDDPMSSEFSPVLFTDWASPTRRLAGDGDCLTVLLNDGSTYGMWKEEICTAKLTNYFLCEVATAPSTSTGGKTGGLEWWMIFLIVLAAIVVLVAIILVVCLVIRRVRKARHRQPLSMNNLQTPSHPRADPNPYAPNQ